MFKKIVNVLIPLGLLFIVVQYYEGRISILEKELHFGALRTNKLISDFVKCDYKKIENRKIINCQNNNKVDLYEIIDDSASVVLKLSALNCYECNMEVLKNVNNSCEKNNMKAIVLMSDVSNYQLIKQEYPSGCYVIDEKEGESHNLIELEGDHQPFVFCLNSQGEIFGLMFLDNISQKQIDTYVNSLKKS